MSDVMTQPTTAAGAPAQPRGPDRLLAMGNGSWVSQILRAGAHHKFFTLIAKGHNTAHAIAAAAKTDPRGTRAVLDSLVALNLLTKNGKTYGLTPDADAFLVEGRPRDISAWFGLQTGRAWELWGHLTEFLGDPSTLKQFVDLDEAAAFFPGLIRGIMPLGLGPADATAEHLGIGTTRKGVRILDIGIGSGAWSIPFAKRDATARITGFDIPAVLAQTKQIVAEFGVERQFTFQHGDLMKDSFGDAAYDLVILGNICHGLTPQQNVDLLKRTQRALAAGGQLVIADMLPNEERTGPPFPVLFAVNMFVMGGEDVYPLSDYRKWLADAGFRSVEAFDTQRSHSPVVIAQK